MSKENQRRLTVRDETSDFLLYTAPDGQVSVECVLQDETIWLPQERIAELFGVQRPAITKHLKNIFESGELEEKVVSSEFGQLNCSRYISTFLKKVGQASSLSAVIRHFACVNRLEACPTLKPRRNNGGETT